MTDQNDIAGNGPEQAGGASIAAPAKPPRAATASAQPAYRVLARKYRPQSFADLIGQEPMVRTLTNAFATGRLAQAYLLTGVRGVGKTSTARILARALNYSLPGRVDRPSVDFTEPGEHCAAIMEGRHVDVIEMDAASHTGIGDIREIIEAVRYKPALARYKVYIIDEVHMLSNQAFNGLLKTLEEPPEHVKFVFATTEIRKVPVTVLSRTQRFDLRRIEADRLVGLLRDITHKEGVRVEDAALAMIARAAEGSARDALSLLDQAIAHGGGFGGGGADAETAVSAEAVRTMLGLADRARIIDLFEEIMRGEAPAALGTLADLYAAGADPAVVLQDLANFTHLVTRFRITPETAQTDASLTEEERRRGGELAAGLSLRVLSRCWQMLLKGIDEVKVAARPLAAADMVLVRLAYAADLPTPDETLRRLRNEGAVGAGAGQSRPVPPSGARPGASLGAAPGPSSPTAQATRAASPRGEPSSAPSLARNSAFNSATPVYEPADRARPFGNASGMAAAASSTAPAPLPDAARLPDPGPVPSGPRLERIEDLVALAAQKRDLPLKIGLERYVRPIRIEPGVIELALTEDAPANFAGELSRRLQDWTGRRWVVTVGRGPAGPTLHERQVAAHAKLVTDARADPMVAAVLEKFPGAEIVDVRIRVDMGDGLDADPEASVEPSDDDGD